MAKNADSQESLTIRSMTRAEVDLIVDWAAAEGWNPGLGDADCFYPIDRAGFLIGLLDGKPIASISVPNYDDEFGFLGFYIVQPDFRGNGYGLQIWNAGMAHLGERNVGLDGVVDQQANYEKSGFKLAHRNIRYGGKVELDGGEVEGVHHLSKFKPDEIVTYDRAFFAAPRGNFVTCWLNPAKRKTKVLEVDGAIRGYGVIRPCRAGYKIGPLFADDEMGADSLMRALAAEAGEAEIYIDPPEPNKSAIALAERYGLKPVFETARMYKGEAPDLPLARTFGITTFELG